MHKHLCGVQVSAEAEKQSIAKGHLKFVYVNERSDRTLETHGADTRPVYELTPGARTLTEHLALPSQLAAVMRVDKSLVLPYGHCDQNVTAVVKQFGGHKLRGWVLYEGDHVVEAEMHAVWVPEGETLYVNVTAHLGNIPYSSMFVPDATLHEITPNVIYWKE